VHLLLALGRLPPAPPPSSGSQPRRFNPWRAAAGWGIVGRNHATLDRLERSSALLAPGDTAVWERELGVLMFSFRLGGHAASSVTERSFVSVLDGGTPLPRFGLEV